MSTVKEQLESMIADNNIILFMKGDPHQPQCGFSAKVVTVVSWLVFLSAFELLQLPKANEVTNNVLM